jgi:hypothetical protein
MGNSLVGGEDCVFDLENWTYIIVFLYRWKGGLGGHSQELEGREKVKI